MEYFFKEIINSIDKSNNTDLVPYVNPTEIYNEGWMTRLLVYYSIKQGIQLNNFINFNQIKNWSSEGLISSPFIEVANNREGYTHADMALGDFVINYVFRGKIEVFNNANIFGIIEAKMGSNLSQGTSNAKNYNQASRNLACISYNTTDDCEIFFAVVAPLEMIKKHKFELQLEQDFMVNQIKRRFDISNIPINISLIERAEKSRILVFSYESWIDLLTGSEKTIANDFYKKCKKWNKIN